VADKTFRERLSEALALTQQAFAEAQEARRADATLFQQRKSRLDEAKEVDVATMLVNEHDATCLLGDEILGTPGGNRSDWRKGSPGPAFVQEKDINGSTYRDHIKAMPCDRRPVAICASGGGIRSATFFLGVLQGLAVRDKLDRFRFLSSVSGGGYIASWLSSLLARSVGALTAAVSELQQSAATAVPGGVSWPVVTGPGDGPVSRLRAYSHYLSPIMGLSGDMLALVATFLRNLALNLFVMLAFLAAAILLVRLAVWPVIHCAAGCPAGASFLTTIAAWLTAIACVLLAAGQAYVVADLPGNLRPKFAPQNRFSVGCFLPSIVAAIALVYAGLWFPSQGPSSWAWCLSVGVGCSLAGVMVELLLRAVRGFTPHRGWDAMRAMALLALGGGISGTLLRFVLAYGHRQAGHTETATLVYVTLAFPLVLGSVWVQLTLCAAFARRWTDEEDREWWSRASGLFLLAACAWAGCFGLVLFVTPWVLSLLSATLPAGVQLTGGSAVLGLLTSAFGYWSKNGDKIKQRTEGLISRLGDKALEVLAGAVLLVVAVAITLFASMVVQHPVVVDDDQTLSEQVGYIRQQHLQAASHMPGGTGTAADATVSRGEDEVYRFVLFHANPLCTFGWLVALLALSWFLTQSMGANTFSLHGMYGNRLVRAYLGATRAQRRPHWFTGFDPDDNMPLTDCQGAPLPNAGLPGGAPPLAGKRCLVPVINIALNLVRPSDNTMAWQQRKAESFTATSMYCGTARSSYIPTSVYGSGTSGMSLGRAMTISGAAASPNMGYHSSTLVTLVMTLFNVRLGWWLANPDKDARPSWMLREPISGLGALFSEAFGLTTADKRAVYLSDGGHFENLGLYEMVRRRCHRIMVVDAGCDPRYEYSDLFNAVRKIRVDFGIRITMPCNLPGRPGTSDCSRMAVGRIHYSDRDGGDANDVDGILYLLKPLLNGCESPDLREYASSTPGDAFPQQTTADQFFSETQFESYRVLGLQTLLDSWPEGKDWPWEWDRLRPFDPTSDCKCANSTVGMPPQPAPAVEAHGETPTRGSNPDSTPSGLSDLAQGMTSRALLATALTIGGTVGVIGTVKLSSTELHLSSEDRELLRASSRGGSAGQAGTAGRDGQSGPQGTTGQTGPAGSNGADGANTTPTSIVVTMDPQTLLALSNAAASAAQDARQAQASANEARTQAVNAKDSAKSANDAALAASTTANSFKRVASEADLASAVGHLADEVTGLRRLAGQKPTGEQPASATLMGQLTELNGRVQALEPRRTSQGH